ncbi:hypothetical protein L1987_57976 [Smallanthus sonchifolius]|uniref:Uncharacterized protein n=1 Tax=Smallanthus sonchifolius TaxID=185202 RepID=A0ACB9DEN2_9ASTR|nr:hypothetical protein L1987_57976 [Smallanthus sonchifolius]
MRETPLYMAAKNGCSEAASLLLSHGAFIESKASENSFKGIFAILPRPEGGEFGKFYSLHALNNLRISILCS